MSLNIAAVMGACYIQNLLLLGTKESIFPWQNFPCFLAESQSADL